MTAKIIISGHSGGLGRAMAEFYLAEGCPVFGISRRTLPQQQGLQQQVLDLSDTAALAQWLEQDILQTFMQDADGIVLINNAATVAPSTVCGRQRPSEITAAVGLNIAVPLILSNYVLASRPADLPLKIAHIGSGAGRKPYPGWSVYGATKAALDHHARCVAAENHRDTAIAVIAPGVVDTQMQTAVRNLNQEDFPMLPRFMQLRQNNALASPEAAAAQIAALIADESFGSETVLDVRD